MLFIVLVFFNLDLSLHRLLVHDIFGIQASIQELKNQDRPRFDHDLTTTEGRPGKDIEGFTSVYVPEAKVTSR